MTLPPANMLCFALYSAAHAVQSAYAPLLEPLGLTYPQYLVISALNHQADQTVGQLGAALHLDSNTLTPLLKRMEKAGWVSRMRGTQDERQVRLSLTDAGTDLARRAVDVPACFAEKTGLAMDQIIDLRQDLVALRDQLRPRGAKAQGA